MMAAWRGCERPQKAIIWTVFTRLEPSFQLEQHIFERQLLDLADIAAWNLLQDKHLIDQYSDVGVFSKITLYLIYLYRRARHQSNPDLFKSRRTLDPTRSGFLD